MLKSDPFKNFGTKLRIPIIMKTNRYDNLLKLLTSKYQLAHQVLSSR